MTNGTTYMSELRNDTTYVNKVTNSTTYVSKLRNGITYVSKLTSGMTYVSKLTGGTIYVSKQTSGTTYVSKVTSGTTYVSKVTKGTTYVSKLRNGTIYVSKLTNGTVYVSKLTSGTTYGVFLALCALQGLLALEGELTPILVQMVKSANTNGLLDGEGKTSKAQIVWVYTVLPCCVLWQGHRLCECYTVHPTCVLWHVLVTDCVSVTLCIPPVSYDMSWSQIVWVLHCASHLCLMTCPGHRLCECYTVHPTCVLWHVLVTDCVSVTLCIPPVSYDMSWSQIVWVLHCASHLCLMTCPGHRLCECYTVHPTCVLWHVRLTDCYTIHPSCVLCHVWVTDCVGVVLYIPAVSYDMSGSQIVWVLYYTSQLCLMTCLGHRLCGCCTIHPSCVLWHVWVTDCVGVVLYIPAVSYDMSGSQIVWVLYYTSQLCLMTCLGHRLCAILCIQTVSYDMSWSHVFTLHPRYVLWHVLITDCYTMHPRCVLWHVLVTDYVSVILYIPGVSYDMPWSQIVWVLYIPARVLWDVQVTDCVSVLVTDRYTVHPSCVMTCPGHILCECPGHRSLHCASQLCHDMSWSQIVWVLSCFPVVNRVSLGSVVWKSEILAEMALIFL